MSCNCKIKNLKPRDLKTPIVDQYVNLLNTVDLGAAFSRAQAEVVRKGVYGSPEVAREWAASLVTLFLQMGLMVPLDSLDRDQFK